MKNDEKWDRELIHLSSLGVSYVQCLEEYFMWLGSCFISSHSWFRFLPVFALPFNPGNTEGTKSWKFCFRLVLYALFDICVWIVTKVWNRTRPRALVQNQHTRELISSRNTKWGLYTLYLHACQVRVAVGDSGLFRCCTCYVFRALINSLVCWFCVWIDTVVWTWERVYIAYIHLLVIESDYPRVTCVVDRTIESNY